MAEEQTHRNDQGIVALIGFGEAGSAFASGWRELLPDLELRAYDIKTASSQAAVRERKWADYQPAGVQGCESLSEALDGAGLVFSLVTADQAEIAARAAAETGNLGNALFFDGNSCSPGAKRNSASRVEAEGGRYVDCAIMAPVHPKRHKTPLLISGGHTAAAVGKTRALGMNAEPIDGLVGTASSVKMIRSIMMKGLEALVLECVLAGRRAGVDEKVLSSLEATYPGFDWTGRAAYMMERAMTHGLRRAAEMREVAQTLVELGLPSDMSQATVEWQQVIGDLALDSADFDADYRSRADAILAALEQTVPMKREA